MRLAEMDGGIEGLGGKVEGHEAHAEIDRRARMAGEEVGNAGNEPAGAEGRQGRKIQDAARAGERDRLMGGVRQLGQGARGPATAYMRPTSVSTTRCRDRLNRETPSDSSSCWIWRETALCVRFSSSAALDTLPWRAVASKARRLPTLGRKPRRNTRSFRLRITCCEDVDLHLACPARFCRSNSMALASLSG